MALLPKEDKTINQKLKSIVNTEKRPGSQQMTMTKESGRNTDGGHSLF